MSHESIAQNGSIQRRNSLRLYAPFAICIISKFPYYNALRDCLSWYNITYMNTKLKCDILFREWQQGDCYWNLLICLRLPFSSCCCVFNQYLIHWKVQTSFLVKFSLFSPFSLFYPTCVHLFLFRICPFWIYINLYYIKVYFNKYWYCVYVSPSSPCVSIFPAVCMLY